MNPLTGYGSGKRNADITYQLKSWAETQRPSGEVIDSSNGIFLLDGSSRSPDSASLTPKQVSAISSEDEKHFLRIVPAFIIELRFESDIPIRD